MSTEEIEFDITATAYITLDAEQSAEVRAVADRHGLTLGKAFEECAHLWWDSFASSASFFIEAFENEDDDGAGGVV